MTEDIAAYKDQHAVCPRCFKHTYWKTLVGMRKHPEIKDTNEAHCGCGWNGICDELVPDPTARKQLF